MKDNGKMIKEKEMGYTIMRMEDIKESGKLVNNKGLEYIIGKEVIMK